jgi:hypothetical protein
MTVETPFLYYPDHGENPFTPVSAALAEEPGPNLLRFVF